MEDIGEPWLVDDVHDGQPRARTRVRQRIGRYALGPSKELVDRIYRDRVLRARSRPPAEKLMDGARLFDMSCRIMMDGIRHEHPDADEREVMAMLIDRVRMVRRLEDVR